MILSKWCVPVAIIIVLPLDSMSVQHFDHGLFLYYWVISHQIMTQCDFSSSSRIAFVHEGIWKFSYLTAWCSCRLLWIFPVITLLRKFVSLTDSITCLDILVKSVKQADQPGEKLIFMNYRRSVVRRWACMQVSVIGSGIAKIWWLTHVISRLSINAYSRS